MALEKNQPTPSRFGGRMPAVEVTRGDRDSADDLATRRLLEQYMDETGFHCPKCGITLTNRDDAVEHLAGEINKSLKALGEARATKHPGLTR